MQLPLAPTQLHFNQQLFSDYYLDQILPRRSEWADLVDEAAAVLATLRAQYAQFTPSSIEAQTEDDLIKPVLLALGHTFEVQAALTTPDGTKRPDYIFYRDTAARDARKNQVLNEQRLASGALAVGDAKYWDRPLDTALTAKGGDPFTNKNPGYQIAFYVQQSGLPWGMLTNGRRWRLYHAETAHKLDRFYEVDLPSLLELNDPQAFLYFYAFFRRAAFDDHALGLATLLRASTEFARGIGDNLKVQVYTALRHLAQGFLDYVPNQLGRDPATLKRIYDHCLIVLYRLLFVLYAEARELLPLRTSAAYRRAYSLEAIKRDVARTLDSDLPLLTESATIWPRLRALFAIIDRGSPPLKVSTFNGGLFDPQRYPFLETQSIGDMRLLHALDLLTRVNRQFVDYRDLAERHLGTIYEGLLEYHLAPLAAAGNVPTADEVARGAEDVGFDVALVDSQGERHRTGSYYTPEFVVQYIVEQTLKPILDRAVAPATSDAATIAAVLAINVLDPAMGSGHFLVGATEYIARYLIDRNVSPGPDALGEADLLYWKRRVAQSCVYGVDLNPLAVDLAKLSLWLATAANDKPLSFLDHHMRCGNAVVGVRMSDLDLANATPKRKGPSKKTQAAVAAGQLSMLDDSAFTQGMSTAVDAMWLIERNAANTIDDVKEQEHSFQLVRATFNRRYAHIADLATAAQGFGLTVDRTLWPELVRQTSGGSDAIVIPAITRLLQQVATIAETQRFFHWDLEFPEVFFDRFGQPLGERAGFDVVIGNPPYVRQEQIAPYKPFLAAAFPETYHGTADLFIYFYHQAFRLLRVGGRTSYIVTNKWLRAGYGEGLRAYFAQHATIERLIDFGHAPIFPEADVFPCIIVLEKPSAPPPPDDQRTIQVTAFPREALKLESLAGYVARKSHPVPQRRLGKSAWSLETGEVDDLMEKLRRVGVPLTEFIGTKPYYGIKTGLNEAFLIDTATRDRMVRQDPRSADVIKPYLRGQDIKRWAPEWDGRWMIVAHHRLDIAAYSIVLAHLEQHREALSARAGSQEWWQLQSTGLAIQLFEQPKIVYQVIQFHPQYGFDQSQAFTNDKGFFIPTSDLWLLAVLNSPLMWWHNWRYLPHMKDEALNPACFLLETLPIAPPTDGMRGEIEAAVPQLIADTQADQAARRDTLDWLRSEYNIAQAGQRLNAFSSLSEDAFIEEVKKRRPKSAGNLSPAGLKALRHGYREQATPVQQRAATALGLERRISGLVNTAYQLTPEEVALLWRSAPPRMPVGAAGDD